MTRNAVRISVVVVIAMLANLFLDTILCIAPPCLTKSAAYKRIVVGSDTLDAERILARAGVACIGEGKCSSVMFSDFWKDYSIGFGPHGTVVEKRFTFRVHDNLVFEILQIR